MVSFIEWMEQTELGGYSVLEWAGLLAMGLTALLLVLLAARRLGINFLARSGERHHAAVPREPLPGGHEKILVVDDDEGVREATARILRELGYQTVTAASGDAAVRYMEQNGADLLLLDLRMEPGLNGVETFRRIREFRPLQKAIVMTAYAGPSEVSAVRALGIQHYLIKPAPLMTLARAIRDELDRP